jgi:hypothetical protein
MHQDGLLDILAGLIVVIFGFIPILDETGLNVGIRQVIILLFYGISVLMVLWLKRRITFPRAGYVKLPRKTTLRMSVIMLIINVLLFLLFAITYIFDLPVRAFFGAYQMSIPLGLVFLLMFTIAGALLKATRFYLYGILVAAAFVAFEDLFLRGYVPHHGITYAAFISGGLTVGTGMLFLFRFLKNYKAE